MRKLCWVNWRGRRQQHAPGPSIALQLSTQATDKGVSILYAVVCKANFLIGVYGHSFRHLLPDVDALEEVPRISEFPDCCGHGVVLFLWETCLLVAMI